MKIFFSPSEGKNQNLPRNRKFQPQDLLEYGVIKKFIEAYLHLLEKGSDQELRKLFGSKKIDLDTLYLCKNLLDTPCIEAIKLYSGVGYSALDFPSLDQESQEFLYQNTYIFSNLFGAINARKYLPFYKFNQNYKGQNLGVALLYKELSVSLDAYFQDEEILDLRAEIYAKAYAIKSKSLQPVFLKNGKTLSHFSKYYRGILLRHIAKARIQSLDEIPSLKIEGLQLRDEVLAKDGLKLYYEIEQS